MFESLGRRINCHSITTVAGLVALLVLISGALTATAQECPTQVGFLEGVTGHQIEVSGEIAVVRDQNVGFHVVDISEPEAPQHLATVDAPGWDLKVADGYVYVACFVEGLQIYSISDPFNPVHVGAVVSPDLALYDVAVIPGVVYGIDRNGTRGIQIFDVADPTRPEWTLSIRTQNNARAIAISGEHLLVPNSFGMYILEQTATRITSEVTFISLPDNMETIQVAGNYALVVAYREWVGMTEGETYIHVVDISDLEAPVHASTITGFGLLAVAPPYAFAETEAGLTIFDISEPASPVEVASCPAPNGLGGATVVGDLLYQADSTGLAVLDISFIRLQPIVQSITTSESAVAAREVRFSATVTGLPTYWYWDFGDGSTSTEPQPVHTYELAGPRLVSLTVTSPNGEHTFTTLIDVRLPTRRTRRPSSS